MLQVLGTLSVQLQDRGNSRISADQFDFNSFLKLNYDLPHIFSGKGNSEIQPLNAELMHKHIKIIKHAQRKK